MHLTAPAKWSAAADLGVLQTLGLMRLILIRLREAIVLGFVATAVWLLVSPATEIGAAGRLSEFTARRATSNDALARIWRIQLPGTALACCIFSLVALRTARTRNMERSGKTCGMVLGGSLALLLFTSPPPGAPFYVWGATFYLTALSVVFVVEALPPDLVRVPFLTMSGLLSVWPVVVTGLLATAGILIGGVLGEWMRPFGRTMLQNDKMQQTRPG